MRRRIVQFISSCLLVLLGVYLISGSAYAHTLKLADVTFIEHKGDGYSISYPSDWTFNTNTTNSGGYVGDFFTDPTNTYVFHVYPSHDQTSDKQILDQLLTGELNSTLQSITPTVTVNNVEWQQGKASGINQLTGKQYEKIGWVSKNPVDPDHIPHFVLHAEGDPAAFDCYTDKYFLPMLHSFHFTK
ncbi:hypothetical protein KDA_64630 [Dictyobacter alpinus]|uniref:Uncharacterized protein n=1 Tax=Dictyobacter alpinus TaxID=2014873 RepID=A0A402BI08_9CHLR|nr:hypothetical protein [Dictyobacter alpinus]GCE30979.1 hypothetical protein KDA_64630 [Dictyobacter alpinus]